MIPSVPAVTTKRLEGFNQTFSLDIYQGDNSTGHIWIAERSTALVSLDYNGGENFRDSPAGFNAVLFVAADQSDGSAWILGQSDRVAKYAADGTPLVNKGGFQAPVDTIEADATDGGAWVAYAGTGEVVKLDAEGNEEWRLPSFGRTDSIELVYPHYGRQIHVSNTGSDDSGDGSRNNPYATLFKGLSVAAEGDTVQVAAGSYNENVTLKNRVRLLGNGPETTELHGLGTSHVIDGAVVNRVSISGFTITGAGNNNNGINCVGCRDLVIQNNTIERNGVDQSYASNGIALSSGSDALIAHNRIAENSNRGISVSGDSIVVIRNNIVHHNPDGGISLGGGVGISYVINNVIDSNGQAAGFGGSGIVAGGNVVISNNVISNNGVDNPNPGLAVGIRASGAIDISYNLLFKNFQGNYNGITAGTGDIQDADPLFAGSGDYHLQAESPARNTGDPFFNDEGIDCTALDRRGDMGAYGGLMAQW